MKKALSIMFALLLLFLLPACGGEEDDYDDTPSGGDGGNNDGNGGWESQEGQDWKILKFEDDLSKAYLQQIILGLNDEIYLAGYTYDNLYAELNGKNDPFLLAINSKGKKLWGKQWGVPVIHSSNNDVSGMSVDTDGNIYVTIYGNPSVAKFSPEGTKIWEIFPDLENGNISTLKLDKFNNVYLGISRGKETDPILIKYSNQGKELQRYNISNSSRETNVVDVAVDSEGNIYAGGFTYDNLFADNAGKVDAFLAKIAPDGTQLWGKQWGSEGEDKIWSIVFDNNQNIFVTFGMNVTSKDVNYMARLFSSDGNILWEINNRCGSPVVCGNNIYCFSVRQIDKYDSEGKYLGSSIKYEDKIERITCDNNNIYAITSKDIIKLPLSAIK